MSDTKIKRKTFLSAAIAAGLAMVGVGSVQAARVVAKSDGQDVSRADGQRVQKEPRAVPRAS